MSFVSWPLFYCSRVRDNMAANSDLMESESNLDKDGSSDGVSNITLTSLMTAIQDINRNIERKFSEMENSLEKKLSDSMLKVCEAKIGQVKKEFRAEITKITDRLVTVESRDSNSQCNGHSEPCKLNFIVRNMAERSGENVKNRVNGMIKDGMRISDVSVVSAERKQSRNRKPGVIVATCQSERDVGKVLKSKRDLKNNRQYEQVYVEPDVPLQQRIQNSNLRNIVSVIGEDKLEMRGTRVFPISADRSADNHRGDHRSNRDDSESRREHNDNEWVVQSSRKRRRLDRSDSRANSRSRERENTPVNDRRASRNRSHDRARDNSARDRGSRSSERMNRDNARPNNDYRNSTKSSQYRSSR